MNETLENIMIFINENTNILIGICLFLIFVLVAYLIDNSIKAKKTMKAIKEEQKNKEQEEKEVIPVIPINYSLNNDIKNEIFEESIENNNSNIEIKDDTKNNASNVNIFENLTPVDSLNNEQNLQPESMNSLFEDAIVNNNNNITNEIVNNDTNVNTLNNNSDNKTSEKVDVIYKNDKKLSDILLGGVSNESEKPSFDRIVENNIFVYDKNKTTDVIPKNVESKVEVEVDENELDKIMKKLNNDNIIEEDNYTNIF